MILKTVKPFGSGGAHVILPIKYLGKKVKVELLPELEIELPAKN